VPLFVLATPIGNLEDVSPRALKTLSEADVVACEDTRRTWQLLAHFGLRKTVVRYDNFVHRRETPRLLERLRRGERVALVTDAGTPGISDPGGRLVAEAVNASVPVVPIPGPSSVTAALSASGLPADEFSFLGFLPRRAGRVKKEFQRVGADRTVVFMESTFRLKAALSAARDVFGNVPAVIGREMTKLHEEFIRGRLDDVVLELGRRETVKGEVIVVLSPQLKET